MLDELGVVAELISIGLKTKYWQFRVHETGEKAVFDLGHIAQDTKYPYELQVEQKELCRLATNKAEADENIELRMGHKFEGLRQNEGFVEIKPGIKTIKNIKSKRF